MSWKRTDKLMETIRHYAGFPATGVSLQQMVQFGEKPSTGMGAYDPYASCTADSEIIRNSLPRVPIPLRRTSDTARTSSRRTWRPTRWPERDGINKESAGLVCTIIRGAHNPAKTQPRQRDQRPLAQSAQTKIERIITHNTEPESEQQWWKWRQEWLIECPTILRVDR